LADEECSHGSSCSSLAARQEQPKHSLHLHLNLKVPPARRGLWQCLGQTTPQLPRVSSVPTPDSLPTKLVRFRQSLVEVTSIPHGPATISYQQRSSTTSDTLVAMASFAALRLAARPAAAATFRSCATPVRRAPVIAATKYNFSSAAVRRSGNGHEEETFEEFSQRYSNSNIQPILCGLEDCTNAHTQPTGRRL